VEITETLEGRPNVQSLDRYLDDPTMYPSEMYCNLRGDGGMNELTSPAFASACGYGGIRAESFEVEVEVWGM